MKADIDAWCVKTYDDGHRSHLGASLIGRECSRYLWYVFRWVKHTQHSGRQYRLFQRGHLEEARFIQYLEGIGAKVEWFDANVTKEDGTNPQIRISDCGGHFGGSLDAKIALPSQYNVGSMVFINEYKTHNEKSFAGLETQGVQQKKYEHFCQMSVYGYKMGLQYGIYVAVDKNDDELYIEVVELDHKLAQRLIDKAGRIVSSPVPPEKLSQTITYKTCSYCDMNDVCHKARQYDKNCRSCKYVEARSEAQWYCNGYQQVIPAEFIAEGCDRWSMAV